MKPEKQPPYHHGNLRQALIDIAIEMIHKEGLHSLSLRELARRANVSQTAPYRHFASKEDLIASVAEQGFGLLKTSMEASIIHLMDQPVESFQQLGIAYVLFAIKHPAHLRLMFGPNLPSVSHEGLFKERKAVSDLLMNALSQCRKAGLLREGKLEDLAICAWSMVHGLSILLVEERLPWIFIPPKHISLETIQSIATQVTHHLFVGIGQER